VHDRLRVLVPVPHILEHVDHVAHNDQWPLTEEGSNKTVTCLVRSSSEQLYIHPAFTSFTRSLARSYSKSFRSLSLFCESLFYLFIHFYDRYHVQYN